MSIVFAYDTTSSSVLIGCGNFVFTNPSKEIASEFARKTDILLN